MDANDKIPSKRKRSLPTINLNVLEYISNRNLFLLCCIAACFSLISYLAAFSCEISWILESHGNLPTISYLLCSGYFILFVASTVLIHGLATGLAWGLFSWSVIIGSLAIPELCLVMTITTQFWGLQSTHGLTELIGYIIRLIINCLALLCVIPTGLRWRREQSVHKQLQTLASRLQLATPPPSTPDKQPSAHSPDGISQIASTSKRRSSGRSRRQSGAGGGVDNPAYIVHESQVPFPYSYGVYGSQNEFNASIFGLDPAQYIGAQPPANFNPNRTRSLLDLRHVMPTKFMQPSMMMNGGGGDYDDGGHDETDGRPIMNNNQLIVSKDPTAGHDESSSADATNTIINNRRLPDPIYYTIASDKGYNQKPMMRNCVSLENLGGLTIRNDLTAAAAADPSSTANSNATAAATMAMLQHHHHQHHHHHQQQQQHILMNNARMFSGFGQMYQQYPPLANMQYNDYWNWSRYGGGNGVFNHLNPYVQNRSNTNSKQSLGSDDYRKYRDVAL